VVALCSPPAAAQLVPADPASCRPVAEAAEERPAPLPDDPAAAALEQGNRKWEAGEGEVAWERYRESLGLAEATHNAALAALAAANLAMVAVESGRADAPAALADASARSAGLDDARVRSQLRNRVGRSQARLAIESGATPLRAEMLRAAARSFDLAARDALEAGDVRAESIALGELAALYEGRSRVDEATVLTRRAILLAADAPEVLYRWQWQLARLQRAAGDFDAAIRSYRAAVATLAEIRADTLLAGRERKSAFRSRIEPLYLELVDMVLQQAARSEGEVEQALLGEARNVLENLKTAELRDYFDDPCLAQRATTPESVPGALVLYPVPLPDRMELIVGRAGRLARYTSSVDRHTLRAELRVFRSRLERLTTRQYLRHARRLYDWLIRPIERELQDGAPDVLVVVPGGLLRTIPFQALHDGESFLVERLPVAVAPGLTLTDPRSIDTKSVHLLAAGISQSVEGYPPLTEVVKELESVSSHFEGISFLDSEFQTERFEEVIGTRPFGIVHVASHAEFFANPDESFVLTWDGRISIDKLASLVETTQFREREPLELLTLSACETAAGDEWAALGLAGIAVRSGARSALATLWTVHDEASALLMTQFYAELAGSGVSRAEALRRAQLKLIRTRHFQHPSYWSPFLLINSWL
jgi:CHAT domain-containing protein